MTGKEIAALLRQLAEIVEFDDSLEGSIEWHPDDEFPYFQVSASVRTGNRDGQGGVILL